MPNGRRGILDIFENYLDMLLNLIAILVAYFFDIIVYGEVIVSIMSPYTVALVMAQLLMSSFVYHVMGFYRPNRYRTSFHGVFDVLRVNITYYGAMALVVNFITREGYKGFILMWVLFAALFSTIFISFKRHLIKSIMGAFSAKQYNLRKVIIVGDNGITAAEYVKQVTENSKYGTMVLGYVGDKISEEIGVSKLGPFGKLGEILDKYKPTDVVFAIDAYDKRHLIKLVNMCDDRCIKVYFLPVIYGFFKHPRQIEQVGQVPLINIHSTPLDNHAKAMAKRAMDIVGSLILIILTSPIMIFAAIGVKLTSPGPILFKQQRVGKLGKKFTMLKFRSMLVNNRSSKEWSTGVDDRKTKFGNFLRKTSIDELPQLFNVLMGSMSLVGPRPEIPLFVEYFKEQIPLYMVKHYVKPGITGLAQVKGLRGDTSVEDRIHEDISYIENWSFMLDIRILLATPARALNNSEKYVEVSDEGLLDDETTRTPNKTEA